MSDAMQRIRDIGIVPAIKLDDAARSHSALIVVGRLYRGYANDLVGLVVHGDGLRVRPADIDAHTDKSFAHISIIPSRVISRPPGALARRGRDDGRKPKSCAQL